MPTYQKMPSAMKCMGPECAGCSSPDCYAEGGRVKRHGHPSGDEAGVHESISKYQPGKSGGTSVAGENTRSGDKDRMATAKYMHKTNLEDLKSMKKPNLYAEGGAVDSWTKREDNERGVHQRSGGGGTGSKAGSFVKSHNSFTPEQDKGYSMESAKREHRSKLSDLKSMKKPNLYAEGGEVKEPEMPKPFSDSDAYCSKHSGPRKHCRCPVPKMAEGGEVSDGEPEMEDELKHAMGGEFMDALERKDHKGIMSALEAIVLSCRGKE